MGILILSMKIEILFFFTLIGIVSSIKTAKMGKDHPQYSLDRSKFFGDLSSIAYCKTKSIQEWSCKLCKNHPTFSNITLIENHIFSILGFVGYNKETQEITLAWRGSIDAKNYIQDNNFQMVSYSGCKDCKIHFGWYRSYMSVADKVYLVIEKFIKDYPNSKIVVTGHSLGASLSEICALELFRMYGSKVKEVHNFGIPRLGNKDLANYIHENIPIAFRVVHNKDIIPHFPLRSFNYIHHPYEVFFDSEMKNYKVCDETGEDESCCGQFPIKQCSFNDHNYYFVPMTGENC